MNTPDNGRRAGYDYKLLGSGILLAFTSSLCCIVPLLAILGATAGSAASLFGWVAPLRPYLLAATALVLGRAFYQAYKPVAKDKCGCPAKKTGMRSKTFLWVITIVSVLLSAFPYYASWFQKSQVKQTAVIRSGLQRTVLQIEGMSCAACEGHVNSALQDKKGVQDVTTSYAQNRSVVTFDSTQISLPQLITAITEETGYTVINATPQIN